MSCVPTPCFRLPFRDQARSISWLGCDLHGLPPLAMDGCRKRGVGMCGSCISQKSKVAVGKNFLPPVVFLTSRLILFFFSSVSNLIDSTANILELVSCHACPHLVSGCLSGTRHGQSLGWGVTSTVCHHWRWMAAGNGVLACVGLAFPRKVKML